MRWLVGAVPAQEHDGRLAGRVPHRLKLTGDPLQHPFDQLRQLIRGASGEALDGVAGYRRGGGHRLGQLQGILLDEIAGYGADLLRAAEGAGQLQNGSGTIEVLERAHDATVGAGEAVDALPVITDHAEEGVRPGRDCPQQASAGYRRVLVLIRNDQFVR
ncbi:hypothetical protein FQZ97_1013430 [compost metagenome]